MSMGKQWDLTKYQIIYAKTQNLPTRSMAKFLCSQLCALAIFLLDKNEYIIDWKVI